MKQLDEVAAPVSVHTNNRLHAPIDKRSALLLLILLDNDIMF